MTLSAEARALIETFPLGFVATVTPEGAPRVSPKGTFLALDDKTLGFAAIRSPGTLANLSADPAVEVNFIDPFARKAVRARGAARIERRGGEGFDALAPKWRAAWPDLADRITALVLIDVAHAEIVLTPPYDDGVTEADMIALYKAKYGALYP